jgi:hypothetical protein
MSRDDRATPALPFETVVLGGAVTVTKVDVTASRHIVAICQGLAPEPCEAHDADSPFEARPD